jgi:hypothetical protein
MVYALKNLCHYLLGSAFKLFTDHYTFEYLDKKHVLGGRICWWGWIAYHELR